MSKQKPGDGNKRLNRIGNHLEQDNRADAQKEAGMA